MTASLTEKKEENEKGQEPDKPNGNVTGNGDTAVAVVGQEQRTFHFVIKSPPKASFIKMMHKMTKPFLNEVTWYLVSSLKFGIKDCYLPPISRSY